MIYVKVCAGTNHYAHILACIPMQSFSELELLEGGPVPVGRGGHAACCLNYGSPTPQLLISGGRDDINTVLSDSWILDVVSRRWWEVRHGWFFKERRAYSPALHTRSLVVTVQYDCVVTYIVHVAVGTCNNKQLYTLAGGSSPWLTATSQTLTHCHHSGGGAN